MSLATTKRLTRWMPINAQRILTLPMCTSRHVFNCSKTARLPACPIKLVRQHPKMYTLRRTSLPQSTGLQLLNGVLLSLSNLLTVLLHQLSAHPSGTAPWHRFVIPGSLPSN